MADSMMVREKEETVKIRAILSSKDWSEKGKGSKTVFRFTNNKVMAKKKKPEVKKSDILSRHIPDNCTVFVGIDPGFAGGALCKIKVSKRR